MLQPRSLCCLSMRVSTGASTWPLDRRLTKAAAVDLTEIWASLATGAPGQVATRFIMANDVHFEPRRYPQPAGAGLADYVPRP